MACDSECMCDSQEAHDAALEREAAYWRGEWMKARRIDLGHECASKRGLTCEECGRTLVGDALADAIDMLEAKYARRDR